MRCGGMGGFISRSNTCTGKSGIPPATWGSRRRTVSRRAVSVTAQSERPLGHTGVGCCPPGPSPSHARDETPHHACAPGGRGRRLLHSRALQYSASSQGIAQTAGTSLPRRQRGSELRSEMRSLMCPPRSSTASTEARFLLVRTAPSLPNDDSAVVPLAVRPSQRPPDLIPLAPFTTSNTRVCTWTHAPVRRY